MTDDEYLIRYLREFSKHIGDLDLRNALDVADASLDGSSDRDPEEDARSEVHEWKLAS